MPPHSTELSIPARFAELPGVLASVAGLAQGLDLPTGDVLRIQLVIEELVSNSITHGFGGECDQMLTIVLRARPNGITLVYRDQAPPFDLSLRSASDPGEGQIGGLGINLILGFARQIRYQRLAGGNLTEIDL